MSKQFGIKEVLNYCVYDYSTGTPMFTVDYATDTSVETKGDRLDLKGGQGNYKLLSFDHSKDASFKSTLPLVDLSLVSMLTGKPLSTGATQVPKKEILYADATNKITLTQTPVTGTLQIYTLVGTRDIGIQQTVGTPGTTVNTYSISGASVTLNTTTAPQGTAFIVFYDYMSSATSNKITLTADKFPSYVRITGDGLMTDQITGVIYPITFDIKKAKVKPNFTLTMASSKATELQLEYDLYTVDVNNEKLYLSMTQIV